MIILEPKEKPAVIFAEVSPVGRCAKQSASVNIAEPVINVITLRLNAANNQQLFTEVKVVSGG